MSPAIARLMTTVVLLFVMTLISVTWCVSMISAGLCKWRVAAAKGPDESSGDCSNERTDLQRLIDRILDELIGGVLGNLGFGNYP